MDKQQLKGILKPLIKECIKEVMFEDGVLSGIVSEVAQGLGSHTIVESQNKPIAKERVSKADEERSRLIKEQKTKFNAHKKSLLDAIGKDAYNGIDLFEGTRALSSDTSAPGPLAHIEATDKGVNIDGLFGVVGNHWKAHLESEK